MCVSTFLLAPIGKDFSCFTCVLPVYLDYMSERKSQVYISNVKVIKDFGSFSLFHKDQFCNLFVILEMLPFDVISMISHGSMLFQINSQLNVHHTCWYIAHGILK